MDPDEFRRHGHALVEWIADYLSGSDRYPVLPRVPPGDVRRALPSSAPEHGESFDDILRDFERVIVPALTHWNHPGFFAYFAITASAPGVLAEFLSAALNQQAMLWRTSPAATELEDVSLGWLRGLLGLPDAFEGVIYDTASMSTRIRTSSAALPSPSASSVSAQRLRGCRGAISIASISSCSTRSTPAARSSCPTPGSTARSCCGWRSVMNARASRTSRAPGNC